MKRLPFLPIERLARVQSWHPDPVNPGDNGAWNDHQLAETLAANRGMIYKWRERGLTSSTADRLATRLGYHPTNIWGLDWENLPRAYRIGEPATVCRNGHPYEDNTYVSGGKRACKVCRAAARRRHERKKADASVRV